MLDPTAPPDIEPSSPPPRPGSVEPELDFAPWGAVVFGTLDDLGTGGDTYAGTSAPDPTREDFETADCTQDYCVYQNNLDKAACNAELAAADSNPSYRNCQANFIPGTCGTSPVTGCRVQATPSSCSIQCEDLGVSYVDWWGLTGQELAAALQRWKCLDGPVTGMRCETDSGHPGYLKTYNRPQPCENWEECIPDPIHRAWDQVVG